MKIGLALVYKSSSGLPLISSTKARSIKRIRPLPTQDLTLASPRTGIPNAFMVSSTHQAKSGTLSTSVPSRSISATLGLRSAII